MINVNYLRRRWTIIDRGVVKIGEGVLYTISGLSTITQK